MSRTEPESLAAKARRAAADAASGRASTIQAILDAKAAKVLAGWRGALGRNDLRLVKAESIKEPRHGAVRFGSSPIYWAPTRRCHFALEDVFFWVEADVNWKYPRFEGRCGQCGNVDGHTERQYGLLTFASTNRPELSSDQVAKNFSDFLVMAGKTEFLCDTCRVNLPPTCPTCGRGN